MEIGIVGIPICGKTTIFNALTRCKAETATFGSTALVPNIGVAKIIDPRLLKLEATLKPRKTVPAEIKYTDVALAQRTGKPEFGAQLLAFLSKVDALIQVVRLFDDPKVPHPNGTVDAERDINAVNLELAFSDLAILERRLERITDTLKGARGGERDAVLREQALLLRIKESLEKEIPMSLQTFNDDEKRLLENYQFLTAKPMLVVLNIGENQLPEAARLEDELRRKYQRANLDFIALSGKLEMELTQLEEEEARAFRTEMGLKEPALDRVVRQSCSLLGLITFFTIASSELKAWLIPCNTAAPRAAGKIHSDLERGFIRAEVITFEDLVKCGNLGEARRKGLLRLEGKSYAVRDGDVITFLFNV